MDKPERRSESVTIAMKPKPSHKNPPWYLYILECCDETFYTGISPNPEKRVQDHNTGKGARYTRSRRPVKIVYQEICEDKSAALSRECQVKALPRKLKEELVKGRAMGIHSQNQPVLRAPLHGGE